MPVPFDTFEAIHQLTQAGLTEAQAHAISDLLKHTALVSAEQLVTKEDLALAVGALKLDLTDAVNGVKLDLARVEGTLRADLTRMEETGRTALARVEGTLRSDLTRVEAAGGTALTRVEGALRTEIDVVKAQGEHLGKRLSHLTWGIGIGASAVLALLLLEANWLWQLVQRHP